LIPDTVTSQSVNSQACFKKGIEKLAASILPGKHNKTKAQLLMDTINDGSLFNGEAAGILQLYSEAYVRNLFWPWRILKAGDTSPVGAFKFYNTCSS
jgi:hypothetical protein